MWSLVQQAHAGPADAITEAQRSLMQRYHGAAYRYLLGATRDEEAALDLFQEFALRFVRGDFRRASPDRGRFRDYVRTALMHLVSDYRKDRRDWPRSLSSDFASPDDTNSHGNVDAAFTESWRQELLDRTWEALARQSPHLHTVLLCHVENPDMPSRHVAELVSARADHPATSASVRVALHRAREKFAELLVAEVAHSLESPSETDLAEELRTLRMLQLCRNAFEKWAGKS
jgi:RNA polymerase sigma-70 factor (ECF subfamily)